MDIILDIQLLRAGPGTTVEREVHRAGADG